MKGNWIFYQIMPTNAQLVERHFRYLKSKCLTGIMRHTDISHTWFSLWTNFFPYAILMSGWRLWGNYIYFCFIWAIVCVFPPTVTEIMRNGIHKVYVSVVDFPSGVLCESVEYSLYPNSCSPWLACMDAVRSLLKISRYKYHFSL